MYMSGMVRGDLIYVENLHLIIHIQSDDSNIYRKMLTKWLSQT